MRKARSGSALRSCLFHQSEREETELDLTQTLVDVVVTNYEKLNLRGVKGVGRCQTAFNTFSSTAMASRRGGVQQPEKSRYANSDAPFVVHRR